MNRRKLFKMLPMAGIAVAANEVMPKAVAHEIKPSKRYLLKCNQHLSQQTIQMAAARLKESAIDNIMFVGPQFEIYELEK